MTVTHGKRRSPSPLVARIPTTGRSLFSYLHRFSGLRNYNETRRIAQCAIDRPQIFNFAINRFNLKKKYIYYYDIFCLSVSCDLSTKKDFGDMILSSKHEVKSQQITVQGLRSRASAVKLSRSNRQSLRRMCRKQWSFQVRWEIFFTRLTID